MKNYLKKTKQIKAPLNWKSSPNSPSTQLAYVTQPEIDLLVKANEKFLKILEKHIKKFGEEGKGNNVTLDTVYGEKLPDTIKLLGARIKELESKQ